MEIPPRTSGPDDGARLAALVTELATATEAVCAIAAGLTLRAGGRAATPEVHSALDEVLGLLGIEQLGSRLDRLECQTLARAIEARVAHAQDFASAPDRPSGSDPPWELLESQWLTADALADALHTGVMPQLEDLCQRMQSPGARFLDVGTGLAGLAIALCRLWPQPAGIGIDTSHAAIAGARERVAAADLTKRVQLRVQDAAQLQDRERFDFAWVPTARIRANALGETLRRVLASTRTGGWVVVAALGGATPLSIAIARLRTARIGGAVLTPPEAEAALRSAGWADVRSLPRDTLQSLWMTAGRRPRASCRRLSPTPRARSA
ncbi:MAG TPA: class I SAM-dependent methyltransferase [Solirubrobacteraceae bacterium]|jgi:SAM-dependent methyltransferase